MYRSAAGPPAEPALARLQSPQIPLPLPHLRLPGGKTQQDEPCRSRHCLRAKLIQVSLGSMVK